MIMTVFSENGRGRHLCRWALERGFQVNMVLPEQEILCELPFGEWIKDENTDWAMDFFSEGKNLVKHNELIEISSSGQRALSVSAAENLQSAEFDFDQLNNLTTKQNPPLYQRQWGLQEFQTQLKKMSHKGLEQNQPINNAAQELIFDFRTDLRTKPVWQWASAIIQWDLSIYEDVIPSQFVWVHNYEEYLAYENFSFVQKQADGQWKVFLKLPFQADSELQSMETTMGAWLANFKQRWAWVKAEWTGLWQLLPFYQWKKLDVSSKPDRGTLFYDMGPRFLGSYSFEKQWKLENQILKVLTESSNRKKKGSYDFKIHAS